MALFVAVRFYRSFEGIGGLNVIDVKRETIRRLQSTVGETALAKGSRLRWGIRGNHSRTILLAGVQQKNMGYLCLHTWVLHQPIAVVGVETDLWKRLKPKSTPTSHKDRFMITLNNSY